MLIGQISHDARIYGNRPNDNFGSSSSLRIDGRPNDSTLVWFDVSAIPEGSVVQSVSLMFTVSNTTDDAYEIYEILRPWVESEVTYNEARDGAVWQVAGLQGSGDRGSTVLGTLTGSEFGPATFELNAAGVAVVQDWVDDPDSNYGFVFQDYDNARDKLEFYSSDSSDPDQWPTFCVAYTADTTNSQNEPPEVNAGSNQTIFVGQALDLDGTVSDDGLPGPVTTTWSVISGPDDAAFDDASDVDTAVTFSTAGTYVLQLSADDGDLTGSDEVTVTVEEAPPAVMVTMSFQDGVSDSGNYSGTRDTTLRKQDPDVNTGADDELTVDGSPDLATLLRWDLSGAPEGSVVKSASITLNVTNVTSDEYEIYALLRPWVEQEATWKWSAAGTPWSTAGALGSGDRGTSVLGVLTSSSTGLVTIALNSAGLQVVQSWLDNPAANYGLVISDYDNASNGIDFDSREVSTPSRRPKLTLELETGGEPGDEPPGDDDPPPENQPPSADAGPDQSVVIGDTAQLNGSADDDGLPSDPGTLTYAWSQVSGPGTADFANANQSSTSVSFDAVGEYRLRLTVNDGDLADTDDVIVSVADVATSVAGVWISPDQLANLPTSGAAWERLLDAANEGTNSPDISDQDDDTDVNTLAKALVGVRLNDQELIAEARAAIMAAIDTEDGGRTLALGRNLPGYIIAADLVGLSASQDAAFRAWLQEVLDENLDGRTLTDTHEERPNNWGTMAGAARAAIAVYLGDEQELERIAQVFKGWLGDRSSYSGFSYGDLSWQADPNNPVGINPQGATKDGHSIDGALPEEMRRGGSFDWPPNETGYPWEGLQGAVVQAEILFRAGYNTWQWEDRALLRSVEFLYDIGWDATGDDEWIPWLIDAHYGTDFAEHADARPGKNMGWTAWTHGSGGNLVLDSSSALPASVPHETTVLSTADLQPIVEFALAELKSTFDIPDARLAGIVFEIVDLPGSLLGQAAAGLIRIDDDALGIGWFIDASPADADEFYAQDDFGEFRAQIGSAADGRIDLLSVVRHELGHLLGLDHDSEHDVMQETLSAGTRRSFDLDASELSAADEWFHELASETGSLEILP